MIQITFKYTPENLQEAYLLHYKKNFPLGGRMMLYLGIMLVWTGLLLVLISRNEGRQVLNYSFVTYGILIIIIHTWVMNTLGKRTYKKLKGYQDPINISVSEQEILMKTEKGESRIGWENLQQAVISDSIVLLYPAKSSFYLFPKKDFRGEDFTGFQNLVKEKIPVIK